MYACIPEIGGGFFGGGVSTQQCDRPFLRPTPTPQHKKPEPHCQGSGPKGVTHHSTVGGALA
jgi:hypothetical protein